MGSRHSWNRSNQVQSDEHPAPYSEIVTTAVPEIDQDQEIHGQNPPQDIDRNEIEEPDVLRRSDGYLSTIYEESEGSRKSTELERRLNRLNVASTAGHKQPLSKQRPRVQVEERWKKKTSRRILHERYSAANLSQQKPGGSPGPRTANYRNQSPEGDCESNDAAIYEDGRLEPERGYFDLKKKTSASLPGTPDLNLTYSGMQLMMPSQTQADRAQGEAAEKGIADLLAQG